MVPWANDCVIFERKTLAWNKSAPITRDRLTEEFSRTELLKNILDVTFENLMVALIAVILTVFASVLPTFTPSKLELRIRESDTVEFIISLLLMILVLISDFTLILLLDIFDVNMNDVPVILDPLTRALNSTRLNPMTIESFMCAFSIFDFVDAVTFFSFELLIRTSDNGESMTEELMIELLKQVVLSVLEFMIVQLTTEPVAFETKEILMNEKEIVAGPVIVELWHCD